MVDSSDFARVPPWPVRWALGVPVVAAASSLFFARAWGYSWQVEGLATVSVAGWILGLLGQWAQLRPGWERRLAVGGLVAAVAAVVFWVGWRLPRGLIWTSLPVVVLAIFQCLLGLGRHHVMPLRVAVAGGGLVALLVLLGVPVAWPPLLRLLLSAVVVAGVFSLWREAGRVRLADGSQRLANAVIFAAGVWLPQVWWRPGGLLAEFLRWENAAFLVLVWLVAWSRPDAGLVPAGFSAVRRRSIVLAALVLAALAAAGWGVAWERGWSAPRTIFLGVGVGALVLAAGVGWSASAGRRVGGWLAWCPEGALLAMAWVAWLV